MSAIHVENLSKVYRTRIKEEGLKASFKALFKPKQRVQQLHIVCRGTGEIPPSPQLCG